MHFIGKVIVKKKTALAIIITVVVIVSLSIAIPALSNINADFGSHSSADTTIDTIDVKELDPIISGIIDGAPDDYIITISQIVRDTLDMYFTEKLGVEGELIFLDNEVYFVATSNQYFSSLEGNLPGYIYARVEYSIEKAYHFEGNDALLAFADAVEKCRAFEIGDESVSEKEVKKSFKTIALINDVDLDLLLEIVSGSRKYQKLKNKCYNKFKYKYDEMFASSEFIAVTAKGHIRHFNDDKELATKLVEIDLLNLYKTELQKVLAQN